MKRERMMNKCQEKLNQEIERWKHYVGDAKTLYHHLNAVAVGAESSGLLRAGRQKEKI